MTARQEKLERVLAHLTEIPARATREDMQASVLAAIGGLKDLVSEEAAEWVADRPYSVRLADEQHAINQEHARQVAEFQVWLREPSPDTVTGFAARLRQLSRDMNAAVALTTQIRNGVLS